MINLSLNPARHLNVVAGEVTVAEDLSINKIESIYELVLEYIFKVDVPETQDADEDGLQKPSLIYCMTEVVSYDLMVASIDISHNHAYTEAITEYIPFLDSPPPKAQG